MATNSPGSGKEVIGAGVTNDVAAFVTARADRLEKSKAWAVGRIIDLWIEAGAPALSEVDAKFPVLTFEKFLAERKASTYGVKVKPRADILHPAKTQKKGAA